MNATIPDVVLEYHAIIRKLDEMWSAADREHRELRNQLTDYASMAILVHKQSRDKDLEIERLNGIIRQMDKTIDSLSP
jgi:hypothetical protein